MPRSGEAWAAADPDTVLLTAVHTMPLVDGGHSKTRAGCRIHCPRREPRDWPPAMPEASGAATAADLSLRRLSG